MAFLEYKSEMSGDFSDVARGRKTLNAFLEWNLRHFQEKFGQSKVKR